MKIAKRLFALLLVFCLLLSTPVVWASASTETKIVSQQLSLGDDLTMRFAVATDNANASIWVTVGDNAAEHKVSETTPNASGHYVVSVELAAAQMTDTISVQVKDGDSVLTEGSYSIRDYCVYILEGSYDDATKQMVKEVLNYGAAAQEYFQYNTGNPANTGYVIETTAQIPTDIENMSVSDSLSGISFYGATLLFHSKVAIRYYFSAPDGVTGYTFTANGKTYEATKKDELYYVEVAGINPQQLDQAVTLEVTDGTENTLAVSYSPLHYMARMSAKNTTSEALKALLTAMYSYHLEACEYVGLVETDDREAVSAQIIAHEITGPWLQDRADSSSMGPQLSYDGNASTKWNPEATDFASGESIVYKLDQVYDLTELQVTVSNREFFFEVSVSADGESFVTVHTVTEENMASVYTDLVCTLSMADADAVKYVKLTFLGSNASDKTNTFVNLNEVALTGRVVEDDREEVSGTIVAHEIVGTWVKDNATSASVGPQLSYDGVSTTKWNPQATNYKSGEGIVYTLEKAFDLTKVVLTFGSRQYYFTLHVSSNGTDYTQVAVVTADDATGYDSNYVCTVDGLSAENVKYIKLLFTGNAGTLNTFINLFDVAVSGKEIVDTREEVQSSIIAHELVGTWTNGNDGSASLGPQLSYDGSSSTNWQGQATNYTKGEGIVYTLDSYYDLTKVQLTFKNRQYYFTLHASANGTDYTQIAEVTADNQADYFTDLTCTVEGLDTLGTKYLKVLFTGNEGTLNTYIGLYETEVFGKRTVDNREIVDATIIANEVVGTWTNSYADSTSLGPQKSYDGDTTSTFWQGQATNYKSGEGIIFTLDNVYDLSEVKLYFRNRQYYFDMYVSSDGSEYTQAASVTADNQADYFVDQVCTISDLTSTGVKYIKILFTGNEGTTNLFLGLYEIQISGKVGEIVEGSSFAVSGVFSSNMVLQREQEIPVWGWADEGDTVTGTFAGNTATATADANGAWKLTFPAQSANAEGQTMVITSGGQVTVFDNILIGDVYIVNGQSNAELPVNRTAAHLDNNGKEAIKELFRYDDNIRLFHQTKAGVLARTDLWNEPQSNVINEEWHWVVATENDAFWKFSAMGMYFAKNIRESISEDVPIGLIQTAAGGAFLDELMPNELNAQFGYTGSHVVAVGGYYNTMIHPFVGYPIAGMMFFQGESNNFMLAEAYGRDLAAYVTELRTRWGMDFNFYNVQLSSYGQQQIDNGFCPCLPQVRNQQYQVLDMLDNYYLTVSMDVGYAGETDATGLQDYQHPKDKKTLGERIAKQALAVYYKELAVGENSFSPVPSDIQWNTDGIIISFENADTLALATGDSLVGFQCVINEEVVDVAAQIVNGNQVKLAIDATTVSEIRYAMFSLGYPENANLVNGSGLPAPAFVIANPGEYMTTKIVIKRSEPSTSGWKSLGASSALPYHSYDGKLDTYWNPQVSSFSEEPSITYYLNKAANIYGLSIPFMNRQEYFTLYASTDGSTFDEVAQITANNYTDYVCTVGGLNLTGVTAIKIVFTGSSDGSAWIGLYEVELNALPSDYEESVITKASFVSHNVVGTWVNADSENAALSYDSDSQTAWNPEVTDYTAGEGIVYELDGIYNLNKLQLSFGSRKLYMNISVSTDGSEYTSVAQITAANAALYYNGNVCTVTGVSASNVRFIKVEFTGSSDESNYIDLFESVAEGEEGESAEPTEPEVTRQEVAATVTAHELVGTWAKDNASSASLGPQNCYDGDTSTRWNPTATSYNVGEGIIFTLDKAYDLTKVEMTFGSRNYYFDLSVSTDGQTYTKIAEIRSSNAAAYYTDYVFMMDTLSAENVKYIKIEFVGSSDAGKFVNFFEIAVTGKESVA